MKLKSSILAILLLVTAGNLFAQSTSSKEIVYLKNGSIIKGTIIEWIPNESITIQANDNIFVFKISDIDRVKRDLNSSNLENPQPNAKVKPSIYESNISLGYGLESGKYGLNVFCFNWVYGKNLNANHYVGIGTGIRHFEEINMTMVPLLLDWRYRINQNEISPFVRLSSGYSLNVSNGIDNSGFLIDPRIGMDFKLKNSNLSVDIGYQTQQVAFFVILGPFNPTYIAKVYRFSEALKFSVGLSF